MTQPSDAEVAEATASRVLRRETIRSTALSVTERIWLLDGDDQSSTAILKSTHPLVEHEALVLSLVSQFEICGAPLLEQPRFPECGKSWFLTADLGEELAEPADAEGCLTALIGLAEVHRFFLDRYDLLQEVPKRDMDWLCEHWPRTHRRLEALGRSSDITWGDGLLAKYEQGLRELSADRCLRRLSLVHGDFDPGNLADLDTGEVVALDWGLSHKASPLIDLGHMLERFTESVRLMLAHRYFEELGVDYGPGVEDLVRLGGVAHSAFFVWWHTYLIEEGLAGVDELSESIVRRVEVVAL